MSDMPIARMSSKALVDHLRSVAGYFYSAEAQAAARIEELEAEKREWRRIAKAAGEAEVATKADATALADWISGGSGESSDIIDIARRNLTKGDKG